MKVPSTSPARNVHKAHKKKKGNIETETNDEDIDNNEEIGENNEKDALLQENNENMNVDNDDDLEALRNPKSIVEKILQSTEINTKVSRMTPIDPSIYLERSKSSPEPQLLKKSDTWMDPYAYNMPLEFGKPLRTNSSEKKKIFSDHMREMKHKLLEGLAAPIESDKAMRMMRLMGWKGGALGVRGEGIMEPIQPQLDIPTRVGFGHRKLTSSQVKLNRLQKHILKRRTALNQNEELYSKDNEYIEDGTNRKNRKFKKKEKKSKLIGKKGKNKDRRLNEMEANLSMYSTILNDAFARNDISRNKIDSNDLQTKNNDVTVNFNDLQTEVNDLQDVNANTSVQKMTTNYIENVVSSSNIENMKNSSISDLEVSNKASKESAQIQNNSNHETDDEMVSDDKIMIIDDNSSDVHIVDDEQDDQNKNSADNEYIRDCDDKIVDKDDDYSDVHVIDDTSNQSDQVEVDESCIQTNDVTRALVNEIVMMINDDSCDAQHDSLSNDGQIESEEGDNDDELMINDNQVESDVAYSNYVQSDKGDSDDDNESDKDNNEVFNQKQKDEDDKLENSIKTIIDEAFHKMIDNVDRNIKNISNVIKAAEQIQFQDQNYEQTNDKEVKTNDKGEKTYNEEVKTDDKGGKTNDKGGKTNDNEVKTDHKGVKSNDKEVIPNDKGVITDDKEVIVEIKYVLAYENEKPSQNIDYVYKSDQMVITNYVQTNDEVIADDDNMIDDNDKLSDNTDNAYNGGQLQLDTNCVEINDKEEEKMMIDNDDKSENIDKTINNEEMKGNTNCVRMNDKKIISDDECMMIDDNDKNFENNDNIFNRQIQVNNFSIRTNDDLNFADENIMIDDNDNDKIDDSLNKDVQFNTNVCNDDEESDIDMNIDTDISYHKISAERYEYNQLDMTAKKASNRLQLLVNLLELIQSEYHFTIIRFGFNISNFISYIITTVSRLNRGELFAYKNKRELLLLKAITAEMAAHSDLALVCQTWKKCNTQVAKISKYNNSPVKLRLYEDCTFVTTHPIPENKYDIPNTSKENKYFLLINRIIRDFIQSNDVQRVYEFSSQVGIKSYVNSVIGMLNGQVIFDLGLGGEENDIFCETVERMADVFLIAKYDCPLLYFGKLQLVKVFVTKRCKMCQQGTNSEAENSNNDRIIHENSKNSEEFDGEVNNNSSMKNSPNETDKLNQNGDMNNIPKIFHNNKCNDVMEGDDFGIGSHNSKMFDVKSYEIENKEISKNDKIFDENDSNKNISTNSQNKSNSDKCFEKNIDCVTEFDKKFTKRKLLEENICNKEVLTSDDVIPFIRNEDKNEETEKIKIDEVMEKHGETNEEINKEISNEDIFEKIRKFIEDFDKAHSVNKSTEKKRRRTRRNRKKNDGDNEEFNIGEGVKNYESIYTGNKLQCNSTYTQNYNDNILNCHNEISKHIEHNPIVNSNDITKNTDEKVFAVSNPNIVTKNGTWPKNVIIALKHSPLYKIDFLKSVTHIQSLIYEAIKMSSDIPYIKCESLKTNGIVYSCFDDKSFNWLVNTVGPHYNIFDFKSDSKSSHIIELRIYSFIKVDPKVILNNIQLCYGLNTGEWKVMWERYFPKCYIITIKIDDASLNVIKKENYSLFVGFDKADVILWQDRDY
ncbi:uncharacterized protein [Epargyreus clarus]|uniref:uncharacterized protein n=1 Tax=Epargyreus clarus TaxID=520877 RepID=UPI003C2B436B